MRAVNARLRAILAGAASFGMVFAVSTPLRGEPAVLATVNGEPIYREAFVERLMDGYVTGKVLFAQLVNQLLIAQYARAHGITVSDAEIDAREAETRAKFPPGQFDATTKSQGLSDSRVRALLRQQLELEKAVAPQVHVDDAAVREYYDKNHALYDKPEQVKARHILVPDEPTAQIVLARLRAGASWSEVAKEYTKDPSTRDNGGELGYFSRGQMVPAFQDASFSAPVGELVGPVKSPFGYHVLQVEDRTPPFTATFDAVKQRIHDDLVKQQTAAKIPELMQQIRSKAKIQIYDPRYKDAAGS
jgi:foldase protein PrsA